MPYSVGMVSLGCPKNLVDSEAMLADVRDSGFTITNEPQKADVIIINTCSFIEKAKQESINTILEMAQYKKAGKCKAIIAAGCLAQQYKDELLAEIPELDGVIGTSEYHKICDTIERVLDGQKVSFFDDGRLNVNEIEKRVLSTPPYMAYVKIAEGCDNGCSFCIIPSLRGAYRSRSIESIVEECQQLVQNGVKELILIAQDTSVYGKDIYGKPQLAMLLKSLDAIDGVEWIRILYCYPDYIDDELIESIANSQHVCHYIDMPIQHISDNVLKNMRRKSRSKHIKDLIERLRNKIPDIAIRTSLMVGFPGETEEDFYKLKEFIGTYELDHVGVFMYSQEEGTIAATMPEQIPGDIKQKRYNELMLLQQKIVHKKNKGRIGLTYKVIVEGSANGLYFGRSYYDAPNIDGMIYFTSDKKLSPGQMVDVGIIKAKGYDVIGVAI